MAMKRIRLATKPKLSRSTSTGDLPMWRANSMAAVTVSSEVWGPRTTSTSGITIAGFMKCTLSRRLGSGTTSAKSEDGSVELLVPMIAPASACLPTASRTVRLVSRSSATVSMIMVAPDVSRNYEINKEIPPFTAAPDDGTPWRIQQADIDRLYEFRKCIECYLCQDVCPVNRTHGLAA